MLQRRGKAELGLDPDGIFVVRVDARASVEVEDVRDWISAQLSAVPGRAPVLIDSRHILGMSRAAQETTADPRLVGRTACVAVLVGDAVSVVVGNFFLLFARPPYPTRLFNDEALARTWCSTFLEQG